MEQLTNRQNHDKVKDETKSCGQKCEFQAEWEEELFSTTVEREGTALCLRYDSINRNKNK